MIKLRPYRTQDSSKKITTYFLDTRNGHYALDFGSIEPGVAEVKKLNAIFITHEHSDHWLGLYNPLYAEILCSGECKIYATNVTKALIEAMFENDIKTNFFLSEKDIKNIRKVLKNIVGVLFYEKVRVTNNVSCAFYPSGHTFGSAMVHLHVEDKNILYTGDMDSDGTDKDRQYNIDSLQKDKIDYIICDGTNLDAQEFRNEDMKKVRDDIEERHFDNFLCKTEKIPFFSKKLMMIKDFSEKYCVVYSPNIKWYLKILTQHGYNPFKHDCIVLELNDYCLPENKKPIFISPKPKNKYTSVTSMVGLHIYGKEFEYFLARFVESCPKVFIGHYNEERVKRIKTAFSQSDYINDYGYEFLECKEYDL